jgi:8-oxo-dGTP diphosphatase
MLMVKSNRFNELWFPGGKIDDGEDEIHALAREIEEETKGKLEYCSFFKEYKAPSPYIPDTMSINRIYLAKAINQFIPDNEINEIYWVSRKDFETKKYSLPPITEEKIIPDLIEKNII